MHRLSATASYPSWGTTRDKTLFVRWQRGDVMSCVSYERFDTERGVLVDERVDRQGKDISWIYETREAVLGLLQQWSNTSVRAVLTSRDGKEVRAFAVSIYTAAPP